ncbi:MAG: hypothetical protein R3330_19090, partial [Saprospiraceae bacterium]|nr:hypothetical protein [Saprospiraceae bacterium]
MGAGRQLGYVLGVTSAKQKTVLETAGFVDVEKEDFTLRSDYHDGLSFAGQPETKFRTIFTLRWPDCTRRTLTFIRNHYDSYTANGSLPF